QRQRESRLASCYGENKNREALSFKTAMDPPERHQRERDAVPHQLHREHHHNEIAPREEPEGAEHEQGRADSKVSFDVAHHRAPRRRRGAIAIAPIVATRSSVPASSTANK